MLQRVGIPFHVDLDAGAVRIPFACDVNVPADDGEQRTREIAQLVLVTSGPSAHGVTCTTVLPLRVEVSRRSAAAEIAARTTLLCERLRIDVDPLTGTVAVVTVTHASDAPLTATEAERAVAEASPVGGACYEELVKWLAGRAESALTVCNLSSHKPMEAA